MKVKIADVNSTISITILNVNGLNSLIKRQRLSDWIIKIKISHNMLSAGDIH